MSILANITISVAIGLLTFVGAYKYLPLSWLETVQQSHLFGSTITTIAGTDTLSSSRSVINTNFSNLNTDKFETTGTTLASLTSAASLATVGTITSGTWNATPVTVPYGGTGSTTLSFGQVLIGNTVGNIGAVSGYGTSGQFLTSNGSAAAPTWQSSTIDQTTSYNFTGTYVGIKNLYASSTVANPITLNTLGYSFPATRPASSTALSDNGSGSLSFEKYTRAVCVVSADDTLNNNTASTTIRTCTIPANTLTTTQSLRIFASPYHKSGSGSCSFGVDIGTGSASTSIAYENSVGSPASVNFPISGMVVATSSSNQFSVVTSDDVDGNYKIYSRFAAFNNAGVLYIGFVAKGDGAGLACNFGGVSVEQVWL